jgi:hypothetical protein
VRPPEGWVFNFEVATLEKYAPEAMAMAENVVDKEISQGYLEPSLRACLNFYFLKTNNL